MTNRDSITSEQDGKEMSDHSLLAIHAAISRLEPIMERDLKDPPTVEPDDMQATGGKDEAPNVYQMSAEQLTAYIQKIRDENGRLSESYLSGKSTHGLIKPSLFTADTVQTYYFAGNLDSVLFAVNGIVEFCSSDAWKEYTGIFSDTEKVLAEKSGEHAGIDSLSALYNHCMVLKSAAPFAWSELNAYKEKAGFGRELTFADFTKEVLPKCLERVDEKERRQRDKEAKELFDKLTGNGTIALLQHTPPKRHVSTISNVTNTFASEISAILNGGGSRSVPVSSNGKITTRIFISLDEDKDAAIFSGKSFTAYDRSVLDAITSIWVYGGKDHVFTAETAYRAMNNRTKTERVTPQAKSAVTKSIEKMRRILLTIDATDEFAMRGKLLEDKSGAPANIVFRDHLISVRDVTIRAGKNGQPITAYRLNAEPILYSYSSIIGQVADVYAYLLDVRDVKDGKVLESGPACTINLIIIRDYLIRRIAAMKNDETQRGRDRLSRRILFSNIYEALEIDTASRSDRNKSKQARDTAYIVLDYFKTAKAPNGTRFIKGYTVIKEGKSERGINIIV